MTVGLGLCSGAGVHLSLVPWPCGPQDTPLGRGEARDGARPRLGNKLKVLEAPSR